MVKAYGFLKCHKLGIDNPNMAVQNCDTMAFCALGKPDFSPLYTSSEWRKNAHPPNIGLYLHKNEWGGRFYGRNRCTTSLIRRICMAYLYFLSCSNAHVIFPRNSSSFTLYTSSPLSPQRKNQRIIDPLPSKKSSPTLLQPQRAKTKTHITSLQITLKFAFRRDFPALLHSPKKKKKSQNP